MNSVESHRGKRKRSLSDDAPPPPPPSNPPAVSSNVTQINYLLKARNDKMKLIEGGSETFRDVLGLIDDYEGVLQRHESLAANLGAKLVGPLLVKSFEKLFEGPIKILQTPYGAEGVSITWLDIIDLARTKPDSFTLSDSAGSGRVCQFWTKNCQVQISEDDYRLVISGAPERMIPTQPIADDEIAELGTMDILEQRLVVLIRKADLVAGRARQLNYHLKGRKAVIQARRSSLQQPESVMSTIQGTDIRQSSTPFQPVNNWSSSNGELQALHQDLLRQFFSDDRKSTSSKTKANRSILDSNSPSAPSHHDPNQHNFQSHAIVEEQIGGQYRPLMTTRNEKLIRGAPIFPPCDRCRRLHMDCTKYLTACTGCTRKHAKCSWNDITEEEIVYIDGNAAASTGATETASDEAHTAAADLNANLDPGLRANGEGAGGGQENGGGVSSGTRKADVSVARRGEGGGREVAESFMSHAASTAAATAT